MPHATDNFGTVFERGAAVLLARVALADGAPITRAQVASVRYTIYGLDPCEPHAGQPVAGHDDAPLVVSEVVFDTLQTGGPWTVDAVGYNFRHEVAVGANEAFPAAGRDYQVRYELQSVSGARVVVRFQLRAI